MSHNSQSKVQKVTVFFAPPFKRWLESQDPDAVEGLKSAAELISAINLMTLVDLPFGIRESDNKTFPPRLRGLHKYFFVGWAEHDELVRAMTQSTRIEVRLSSAYPDGLVVCFTFFKKAKAQVFSVYFGFGMATGIAAYSSSEGRV